MNTSGDLLRMLEPAVRPVATPPGQSTPRQVPFEQQSFEQLLDEAGQDMNVTATQSESMPPGDGPASRPNLLSPLSQVDAITNVSLRRIVQGAGPDS